MTEPWLERWEQGRIGWHEAEGNAKLKKYWPEEMAADSRVLVPLCGKSSDLLWLAQRGFEVIGVELSKIAVESFFGDHGLEFSVSDDDTLDRYRAKDRPITIYCGDFFDFESEPFDALFDRAALVAMAAKERPAYVAHTKSLLKPDAYRLIITLEYDQSAADGPPYSVMSDEVLSYWSDLRLVGQNNDIENSPPKFREAGLTRVMESAWSSAL
jgi:thiopurine S-methyltransferase